MRCHAAAMTDHIAHTLADVAEVQPIALDLATAAKAVSLSDRTLRDAIADGSLTAHYAGRKILIRVPDLDAWIESMPTSR